MAGITIKEGESFEAALRRFKKLCEKSGIMTELRKREFFVKPSLRRKLKSEQARKRALKKFRRY
ncbi:MAG: 30S ribosomal protein S21 [Deltaproteobacteria bacterium]|nr:30S ribosomal protein S21 [Deltaproteobacteria bacterium]MBI4224406.1 30S ribosomal protein S21 [Deltaproteobacteria bacterium]